jgi:hypothetical protein
MTRFVVGLFEVRADAERAVEHLIQGLGVEPAAVAVHAPKRVAGGRGPVGSLTDLSLPPEDHAVYEEGVRRGGVVVSTRVEEALADRAMDVLEEYGAADLDAREAEWRSAGWTGEEDKGRTGYTGHDEDIGFATYGGDAVVGRVPRHHHDDTPAGVMGRMEQAAMMRREAGRARARARSYAWETPPAAPTAGVLGAQADQAAGGPGPPPEEDARRRALRVVAALDRADAEVWLQLGERLARHRR